MTLGDFLSQSYQTLVTENGHGRREKISSQAEKVLDFVDQQDKEGARVDERLFSYLLFLQGYDMPHYEEDGYLFTTVDLEREFALLGNFTDLSGSELRID